jgi:hypothetical protein
VRVYYLLAGATSTAGAGATSATEAATGAATSAAGADSVVAVFVASSVLLQPANNANDTSAVTIMSFDFIMLPYFYYNFKLNTLP